MRLVTMSLVRVAMTVVSLSECLLGTEIPLLRFSGSAVSLLNIGYNSRSLGGGCNCGGNGALSAGAGGVWDATLTNHDNHILLQVDDFLGVLIDLNRGGRCKGRR
jgi:hypothetical protein